jgi:cell division protein FtsI (penicillin-binding protein 3)
MLGRTDSRSRALLLLVVILVFGVACVGRLAYWQLGRHADLVAMARQQTLVRTEVPSDRGTIYDRSGTVALATTVNRDRLVAFASQLVGTTPEEKLRLATKRDEIAGRLVTMLALAGPDADALRERLASGKAYVVLARDLDAAQSAAIRAALAAREVSSVRLEPEPVRIYPLEGGAPKTTLAAHLLGFVNREGDGQYGVEGHWQEALAGAPRVVLAERDAAGQPNLETATAVEPGSPGADLTLTLDTSLQLALEREVYAAWVADRAKSVSGVVMDPRTGEILAEATYPSYDANAYAAIATKHPERFVDPAVSAVYEPGSVFKLVTAAAALEARVVTRTSRVNDQAVLRLDHGTASVTNADRGSRGRLTFQDAVAWSRNVVMSKVALRLGHDAQAAARVLHATWAKLGFGTRTGVDLAGEVPGIVRDPATSTWRQVDVANGSFGQGVAVTLLQLATAYSAMVNGGILPTPHVVQRVGEEDVVAGDRGRVLTAKLSGELVRIMRNVPMTVPFYRDRTLIPGYVVGGKTGTAQIWDGAKGRWKNNVFNYSFIGFVGRKRADVVIGVRIEEGTPTILRVGQIEMPVESFQLFRRIASDAMATLDVAPTRSGGAASPSPAVP